MLTLNKFFETDKVTAFVSDRSVDFTLNEKALDLNKAQKEYLTAHTGVPIEQMAWGRQVHGCQTVVIDKDFSLLKGLLEADAFVTNRPNVALAVRSADCLPIFFYDSAHQAIGIAHAGWKGTQARIVTATYAAMQKAFSTDIEDLMVGFGPAIRKCCYKVGSEFQKYFPGAVESRAQGLFFDLIRVNREELMELGLDRSQIFDCRACTHCSQEYFSFRREGEKAGRMIALIMLR